MSSQEQPEDQPPADEMAEEEPSAGAEGTEEEPDDDEPPTEEDRIEQLTERIEKARTRAEDAGVIEDSDEEEYVESGATEDEDDQTITPPG